tara:strand:+ start:761 stop:1030 length:270 start_codon:yes stop_codon:yes gene_type:complete
LYSKDNKLLIHEFKQLHILRYLKAGAKNYEGEETETRIYFDEETKNVIFYQYKYKGDKVIDTNCVEIPIRQFAITTKEVLKPYLSSFGQ